MTLLSDITVSDMTAIISAIAAGVVLIISAVVTGIIQIRNSQKVTDGKLDVIHDATNGNWTKATERIAALEKLIQEKDELAIRTAEEKK